MTRIHKLYFPPRRASLAAVLALGLALSANADPVNLVFTIDHSNSTQSYAGADNSYGAFAAQPGSTLVENLNGNFVVSFDPTTDAPATMRLVGDNANNNNGYFQPDSTGTANPYGTAANFGGQAGGLTFAIRNLVWNFNSTPISASGTPGLTTSYDASSTYFTVTTGQLDYTTTGGTYTQNYATATDHITGSWTLAESAAGSGSWTLSLNGNYGYTYDTGVSTGSLSTNVNIVAHASYIIGTPNSNVTVGNTATVPQPTVGGGGVESASTWWRHGHDSGRRDRGFRRHDYRRRAHHPASAGHHVVDASRYRRWGRESGLCPLNNRHGDRRPADLERRVWRQSERQHRDAAVPL